MSRGQELKDVDEVKALTKHFKAVVKACVEGTWQNYGNSTTAVGFKSLPNKVESEKFKVQKFMRRIDLDYDRREYFWGRAASMEHRWRQHTSKDDELRRDVWGLQPMEWNGVDDDEKSIVEEERQIRAEEQEEMEEMQRQMEQEEREDQDDSVWFDIREGFKEGDEFVKCAF